MSKQFVIRFDQSLVHAANRMNELLDEAELYEEEQHYLALSAITACRALTDLLADPEFQHILEISVRRSSPITHLYDTIIDDEDNFHYFLRVLRKVLINCGVSIETTDRMFDACKFPLRQRASLDAGAILLSIRTVQSDSCYVKNELLRSRKRREELQTFRGRMARISLGFTGATVIGLSAGGGLAAAGLSAAGVKLAETVGQLLLDRGAPDHPSR